MTAESRLRGIAAAAGTLVLTASVNAARTTPGARRPFETTVDRHHYSITARVRPLLVFWITRTGVGDAVVTRRLAPGETDYSLLIGSDPDRAPRRINRWGYLEEEVRTAEARLIGVMTQSDETTIDEAEASARRPAAGDRCFRIIQATIEHDQARSVVKSVDAPGTYTFRDVRLVLDLAARGAVEGRSRVVQLPDGTRPGFLSALAELIHAQVEDVHAPARRSEPIPFVHHGRIYELRVVRARPMSVSTIGGKVYRHVVAADIEIKSTHDGEVSWFSMTIGTEGALVEVPVAVSYQPRWWMQIDLALDDPVAGTPAVGE